MCLILLDIEKLRSGTILVDDSGPHCLNVEAAFNDFSAKTRYFND